MLQKTAVSGTRSRHIESDRDGHDTLPLSPNNNRRLTTLLAEVQAPRVAKRPRMEALRLKILTRH